MFVLFGGLWVAGCGARPAERLRPEPVEFEMEPVVVEQINDDDSAPVLAAYDAEALFGDAKGRLDSHDFAEGERLFSKVLETFPDSRYAVPALYNRGLCLEQLERHESAATSFRRYIQLAPNLRDKRDGEFRWGFNLVHIGDHATAIDLYTRLLGEPDLGDADRAEALLRRGTALGLAERFGEAERDLRSSMDSIRVAFEGFVDGNTLFAEAHYRRAEIYRQLFDNVALALPIERMRADLADKVRFFRQAQASYIDSINVRNGYWGTAAGLRLGVLYERFYRDILRAEVPPDFDHGTRKFYFRELRKQLQPLIEQALAIYEKNITMSQRFGAENAWVAETEVRVERLRSLIHAVQREMDVGDDEVDPDIVPTPGDDAPAAGDEGV